MESDLIRLANEPGFKRWRHQIERIAGCESPIYLGGVTDPARRIAVKCRNRRRSRCAPCAHLHGGDSYQIVRSGAIGGKGVPVTVVAHPQIFATLTAPSFGSVHSSACRKRKTSGCCRHGVALSCELLHNGDDQLIGTPLCGECYDYVGHALWHAHAGELWNRTVRNVRRILAESLGVKRDRLNEYVLLSFVKVAEYQKRGAVHFHSIMRLDGPAGPDSSPPETVTAEMLIGALAEAIECTLVHLEDNPAVGSGVFKWGRQSDVREVERGEKGDSVSAESVVSYLAKYVSKSVGDAGGVDSPIRSYEEIRCATATPHFRALMGACWRLGAIAEFAKLRLRAWAHTLGYRGHVLTKSPSYSTTYGRLRQVRAEFMRACYAEGGTPHDVGESPVWRYVGRGYTPAEAEVARGVREDLEEIRRLRRWAADE
ncbi:replication initiator [Streptomyces sp. NBC_00059]|uniref:replication initiator n=1 Tax=Streptomyces sp. NBC_00059 TaxID=2975635 RepID=UPI002B1E7B4F|nr:replication initiator [Streptomyces sp. NBC_00059]